MKDLEQSKKVVGLAFLREPFPKNLIGKLPKPTRNQTDEVRRDFKTGVRCTICGGWHHPKVIHLDYVGHAALTDRLLDVDLKWNWEPLSVNDMGLPMIIDGLLWIRLTVLGVSRLGVGDSDGKTGGNGVKEAIGDALRNAGMRFGIALDLWHKGDLHADASFEDDTSIEAKQKPLVPALTDEEKDSYIILMDKAVSIPELQGIFGKIYKGSASEPETQKIMTIVYNTNKTRLEGEESNIGEGM